MRAAQNKSFRSESGLALPIALLLILFIISAGTLISDVSSGTYKQAKLYEAVQDTFQNAEGAAHETMRQMAAYPELWRARTVLTNSPASYIPYSPSTYPSTNGIPACTGTGCHRNMYPVSGGLIKNVGAEGAGASDVDTAYPITQQLDPYAPPVADITLNGSPAWSQVERLDETLLSAQSVGGSIDDSGRGSTANMLRFRITGSAFRTVRQRRGLSTVVYVVELPAS